MEFSYDSEYAQTCREKQSEKTNVPNYQLHNDLDSDSAENTARGPYFQRPPI